MTTIPTKGNGIDIRNVIASRDVPPQTEFDVEVTRGVFILVDILAVCQSCSVLEMRLILEKVKVEPRFQMWKQHGIAARGTPLEDTRDVTHLGNDDWILPEWSSGLIVEPHVDNSVEVSVVQFIGDIPNGGRLLRFKGIRRRNTVEFDLIENNVVEFATCCDGGGERLERVGNGGPCEGRQEIEFWIGIDVSFFGNIPDGRAELLEVGNDVCADCVEDEETDVVGERFPGHWWSMKETGWTRKRGARRKSPN
jgi:hypothetical protein